MASGSNAWVNVAAGALMFAMITPAAQAAPIIFGLNADLSAGPVSFNVLGGNFTLFATGDFFSPLAVQTSGNAAFRTVFGQPSSDFTNRGYVSYDANTLGGFGAVPTKTTVNYSNGDNFLGLRVGNGSTFYYGFAYTTNSTLNSVGFETSPNTAIHAVTAVPEPLTWTMLIAGFGAVGAVMRRRTVNFRRAFAA